MRKKRAWNNSNPLYRWLHRHKRRKHTNKRHRAYSRVKRYKQKTGGRMAKGTNLLSLKNIAIVSAISIFVAPILANMLGKVGVSNNTSGSW